GTLRQPFYSHEERSVAARTTFADDATRIGVHHDDDATAVRPCGTHEIGIAVEAHIADIIAAAFQRARDTARPHDFTTAVIVAPIRAAVRATIPTGTRTRIRARRTIAVIVVIL